MADKRILLLAEDDVVLYAESSPEALHAAVLQLYSLAKTKAAAAGPERIDADGEIHTRRWRFIFGEDREDIRAKQRGFLHKAVFPQIAEQVAVEGRRYEWRIWKEQYRKEFLGHRYEMQRLPGAKRATPVRVRISTEDLKTVKAYSDYIDQVIAHAVTEYGVEFVFRHDEREAVRWKPKKRKAAARQEEAVPA